MSNDKTNTSIIVIDGSSASRKMVSQKLAKSRPGIVIDAHATARSAAAKLRDNSYDLVALGHTLPDGNGLDLAAKIRTQREECRHSYRDDCGQFRNYRY